MVGFIVDLACSASASVVVKTDCFACVSTANRCYVQLSLFIDGFHRFGLVFQPGPYAAGLVGLVWRVVVERAGLGWFCGFNGWKLV
jgi:hypothetical protein